MGLPKNPLLNVALAGIMLGTTNVTRQLTVTCGATRCGILSHQNTVMARGQGTFGLSSSRGARGSSFRGSFRGNFRGYRGRGRGRGGASVRRTTGKSETEPVREDDGTQLAERFERVALNDEVDEKLGFTRVDQGSRREGWLINMHTVSLFSLHIITSNTRNYTRLLLKTLIGLEEGRPSSYISYKRMEECSSACFNMSHISLLPARYPPLPTTLIYIVLIPILFFSKTGTEATIEEWLHKKYEGLICRVVREKKEDLKLPNHLMGHKRLYLQLCFRNISDLLAVRRDIVPLALANSAKRDAVDAYAEVIRATAEADVEIEFEEGLSMDRGSRLAKAGTSRDTDPRESIIDVREYDVTYYLRVAMDNDLRVGLWYAVTFTEGRPSFQQLTERVKRADPVVMAYDIETTKAPLKFPDHAIDQVMMISYMVDGQGYLITNREIVSEDIDDFEYTPKEGYEGPFIIFNEPNEVS